jgi:luciferase family oxidoreductase group 1
VSLLPALPVSVLDLVPVGEGVDPSESVAASIAHARRADELGFTRYWLAEHHNMPGIASSAPVVMIAAIAAATERIRVGSGGVMLPNHPPLVVAEQFGTLAALYPGRIDLGLGRAPGTDPFTAAALRREATPSADDFPDQLGELGCFLAGEWPEGHRYARISAVPHAAEQPVIWLLGSSLYSAELAGILGMPFAFAHHFSASNTLPALARYRESFRPVGELDAPHAMVTVNVICAPTDAEAERIALPSALSFLRLRQGRPGKLPSPQTAAAHPWTEVEQDFVASRRYGQAIGSPQTVEKDLAEVLEATRADELMITTLVHDPADRLRSTELVRELIPTSSA